MMEIRDAWDELKQWLSSEDDDDDYGDDDSQSVFFVQEVLGKMEELEMDMNKEA